MAESRHLILPKVLFVIGGFGSGGAETQICELVCRLHGREVDATVLVSVASPGWRLDRLRAADVPIIEFGRTRGFRPWLVVSVLCRQWRALYSVRPDVIYAWLEEAAVCMAPVARLRRIPLVVARRNSIGSRAETLPLVGWWIRWAERSARLVTGNSRAALEFASRRGVERDRLRLVPNAIPPRAMVPAPGAPPVRIGYLCRMRPEKGHLRMLRVLGLLPQDLDWVAKVGGEGPLFDRVRAEAVRAGLERRVDFLGEVSDAADFWDDCHIGMLTSDSEGSPNSLLEAARAGRPLLATAVDGSAEFVVDGTGILVDPDDDQEAAAKLAELITDAGLRARLGARAREVMLARHDPETIAAEHLAVLNEALVR